MRRAPVARFTLATAIALIAAALIVAAPTSAAAAPGSSVPGPHALAPPTGGALGTIAAGGEPGDPTEPPPITVNPFMPAERSLSECLSVVPKPGCGSEARGGPYQAAVFGAIVVGLGVILTRIVIGVRRNRPADPPTPA